MSKQKRILQAQDWFRLTNMAGNTTEAEIMLFGYIGEWDEINTQDLIYAIEQLPETVTTLKLIINSKGGQVYEGNAIYNTLQMMKRKRSLQIETHVYLACSMAGVISLAGDRIIGYTGSIWHAHEVKGGAWGNSKSLRQMADHIDQLSEDIAERYAKRTGIEKEQIRSEWMGEGVEKYFRSDEALQIGLFDEVLDLDTPMPSNAVGDKALHEAFNSILNVGKLPAKPTDTVMDIEKIKSGLVGTGLEASLKDVSNEAELVNAIKQRETELTNAKSELTALKAEQAKKEAEAKKNEAVALVEKAVADKRIVASQKEIYVAQAMTDYDGTEEALNKLKAPANIHKVISNAKKSAGNGEQDPENRDEWTYLDWAKKDTEGLKAMQQDDPEKFEELVMAMK